jgi:hypothetical protein
MPSCRRMPESRDKPSRLRLSSRRDDEALTAMTKFLPDGYLHALLTPLI